MRIVFYDDARAFGGHEVLSVEAARYMAAHSGARVTFVASESNQRLLDRLEQVSAVSGLVIARSACASGTLQGIRSILSPRAVARAERILRALSPDAVIVAQGSVEMCAVGLLAAKRIGVPTISYIPYAHTFKTTASALGALRDLVNPWLYRQPDAFITVAASCARMLREQGVSAPVEVVYAGVQPAEPKQDARARLRAEWGVRDGQKAVGVVARIDLAHKGQGYLVRALVKRKSDFADVRLVIVGDGDDLPRLKSLAASGLGEQAVFVPWQQDPADVYSALDLLVIPSRYEGLPLVLLEAMHAGLAVVATDRDGMADLLPQENLFPFGDAPTLAKVVRRALDHPDAALVERNRERAREEFTLNAFGRAFQQAVFRHVPASWSSDNISVRRHGE